MNLQNSKDSFVNLHGHTTCSFLDGYGTTDQIAIRLKELGQTCCAVTDHGNTFAHKMYENSLRKFDIKPIFGVEAYIVDDMTVRSRFNPTLNKDGAPHITLLAMNQKGYENLLKLVSLGYREGFYYRPRIDHKTLFKYQEGLVVLSGCVGGYPSTHLLTNSYDHCAIYMDWMKRNVEQYFAELIPEPGLDISEQTFGKIIKIANELDIPLVMTSDAHFPSEKDHNIQDTLLCVGMSKQINDTSRISLPKYQYYCTGRELLQRAKDCLRMETYDEYDLIAALAKTEGIANMCNVEIPTVETLHYVASQIHTNNRSYLSEKALKNLLVKDKCVQPYVDNVAHELSIFEEKGFLDYICIVEDVIAHARSLDSIVICRGSAGGSTLLYALGMTATDPVLHELSFERFYDHTRDDAPDIDIDFEPEIRDQTIKYIFNKYGEEKCSRLAALTRLKPKNALSDIARVYNLPSEDIDKIAVMLDTKEDDFDVQVNDIPFLKELVAKYPPLKLVQSAIGQYRQSTIHAAGVLIANDDIEKYISTIRNTAGERIGAIDKFMAAEQGFLKIDMLSVQLLSVIGKCLRTLGMSFQELEDLPLDDPKIYQMIHDNQVVGNFQIDGISANIGRHINVRSFQELYAISALCRPGASNYVGLYIENKFNPEKFAKNMKQLDQKTANIIRETYGVLLYQEQVIKLCREVAGMEWKDVHKLRKLISISAGSKPEFREEFNSYIDKFVKGCVKNGIEEDETDYWIHALTEHGKYSFNKSHCVTYALVTYWSLWLKQYHPDLWYTTSLECETSKKSGDGDKLLIKRIIREYKNVGGRIYLLDPKQSHKCFANNGEYVLAGWKNIHGIGNVVAEKLVANAPYESWEDVQKIMPKATYQKLYDAGITGHKPFNQKRVIQLAYWLPVQVFPKEITRYMSDSGYMKPCEFPNYDLDGNSIVCGWVTLEYKKAQTANTKQQKFIWMVEDENDGIIVTVSKRRMEELGAKMRDEINIGDFVMVKGYWRDRILYANDFFIFESKD